MGELNMGNYRRNSIICFFHRIGNLYFDKVIHSVLQPFFVFDVSFTRTLTTFKTALSLHYCVINRHDCMLRAIPTNR